MSDDGFLASPPTLFLSDADVAELSDWDSAIAALSAAYSLPEDPAATPERVVLPTAMGWQRVMPSAPPGAQFAGSKTISAAVKNGMVSYLITLFDQHDSLGSPRSLTVTASQVFALREPQQPPSPSLSRRALSLSR